MLSQRVRCSSSPSKICANFTTEISPTDCTTSPWPPSEVPMWLDELFCPRLLSLTFYDGRGRWHGWLAQEPSPPITQDCISSGPLPSMPPHSRHNPLAPRTLRSQAGGPTSRPMAELPQHRHRRRLRSSRPIHTIHSSVISISISAPAHACHASLVFSTSPYPAAYRVASETAERALFDDRPGRLVSSIRPCDVASQSSFLTSCLLYLASTGHSSRLRSIWGSTGATAKALRARPRWNLRSYGFWGH